MRTTVDLPDQLYRTVKTAAVERGVSFKRLIQETLEAAFAEGPSPACEEFWERTRRNPPLSGQDADAMLEALAESDRADVELQHNTPDPGA